MVGSGLRLVLSSVLPFEQSGYCARPPGEVCAPVTPFYKQGKRSTERAGHRPSHTARECRTGAGAGWLLSFSYSHCKGRKGWDRGDS